MPYYFMRDTPLQALEQLMMSQPGQKPRGGGISGACVSRNARKRR